MAQGPGKYDHICTLARTATMAEAVVLIVYNGYLGGGFSIQAEVENQRSVIEKLPAELRRIAMQIEQDLGL